MARKWLHRALSAKWSKNMDPGSICPRLGKGSLLKSKSSPVGTPKVTIRMKSVTIEIAKPCQANMTKPALVPASLCMLNNVLVSLCMLNNVSARLCMLNNELLTWWYTQPVYVSWIMSQPVYVCWIINCWHHNTPLCRCELPVMVLHSCHFYERV